MQKIKTFYSGDAQFEVFRTAGQGYQKICQWVGPEDGAPYQAGIAELSRIRIVDYEFTFDDFLFVLEGEVRITQDNETSTLQSGKALFIPKGSVVTIEVPDKLVWTFCAYSGNTHWKDAVSEPLAVEEM